MAVDNGLATIEGLTARVAAWRTRHRAKSSTVQRYQVVFDEAVIADIEAKSNQTVSDELAAAAWELAQGLSRPVTVDLIAVTSEGVEVSRLPMRVLPVTNNVPAAPNDPIVRELLSSNEKLVKLVIESTQANVAQMQAVAGIMRDALVATAQRATAAETTANAATDTARDALDVAREASSRAEAAQQRRGPRERLEEFLMHAVASHMGVKIPGDGDEDGDGDDKPTSTQ